MDLVDLLEEPQPYSKLKKLGKSGEISKQLYELQNKGEVYRFILDDKLYYAKCGTLRKFFAKSKNTFRGLLEARLKEAKQTGKEKVVLYKIDPILAYNSLRRSGFEMSEAIPQDLKYSTGKDEKTCTVYITEKFYGHRKNKELGDVILNVNFEKVLVIEAQFFRKPRKVDRVEQKDLYVAKIAKDIGPTLQIRTQAVKMLENTIRKYVHTSKLLYDAIEEAWYDTPKGWLSRLIKEVLEANVGKSRQKQAEMIVSLLYRLEEIKIEGKKTNLESLCLVRH